jgi:hypothetical protein
MSKFHTGLLKHRAKALRIGSFAGIVRWEPMRNIQISTERKSGNNIFSSVGMGAESWEFILRKQDLAVTDAIEWQGQHFFLTDVRELKPGFLQVSAARVNLVQCQADRDRGPDGLRFPAAMTEKYIRHEDPGPMSINVTCYVLVTPKCVSLRAGSLVDVAGEAYEVLCCHTLDDRKNEFEVCRTRDL